VITRRDFQGCGPRRFFHSGFCSFLPAVLLIACISSAAAAPKSKAEKPYALIFGTVWGPDDQPLYGVKVKIRLAEDKKARWELYSDHRGEFAQRVPVGKHDYVVWADLKGYKYGGKTLQLEKDVEVHVENDERADIGLHLKYGV